MNLLKGSLRIIGKWFVVAVGMFILLHLIMPVKLQLGSGQQLIPDHPDRRYYLQTFGFVDRTHEITNPDHIAILRDLCTVLKEDTGYDDKEILILGVGENFYIEQDATRYSFTFRNIDSELMKVYVYQSGIDSDTSKFLGFSYLPVRFYDQVQEIFETYH